MFRQTLKGVETIHRGKTRFDMGYDEFKDISRQAQGVEKFIYRFFVTSGKCDGKNCKLTRTKERLFNAYQKQMFMKIKYQPKPKVVSLLRSDKKISF